jgi:hypothetical protein
MTRKLTDLVRVGRWLLGRLSHYALRCKRLLTFGHKKEPKPEQPATEHVVTRGDCRLSVLSTHPVILKPSYFELVAPVRDLPSETPAAQLADAIQNLHLVKIGSPHVFPVEMYLSQLQSTHGLSECVQAGTSSKQLALELLGHTNVDEPANDFVIHFSRAPADLRHPR